jgi:hypothetical protein
LIWKSATEPQKRSEDIMQLAIAFLSVVPLCFGVSVALGQRQFRAIPIRAAALRRRRS